MSVSLPPKSLTKKTNYRVRFRHGVFPDVEGQATRADIKKYDYFFAAGQKWVGTEGKLDFIDESRLVAEEFEGPANASEKKTSKQGTNSRTTGKISERGVRSFQKQDKRLRPRTAAWTDQAPTSAETRPSVDSPWQFQQHASPRPGSLSNYSSLDEPSPIDSLSDCPSPRPYPTASTISHAVWPLSDPIEAHLFRFWVEQASTSLDITNSAAVFKEVVPRLAFENPMLMNAIFMISAQNVLRYDPHFPAGPYLYHDRILQDLIPYLAERGRIEDEATLVTAMLLRIFEEFHAGTRGQTHLSTYELFHGPEGWLLDMSRPVVQACLMVHVHAELCQVLLDRPILQIDYRNCILPALVVPEDDASWGNQMLWLSTRIMQWMTSAIRTSDERQYLSGLVDEWKRKRPAAFDAIHYRESLDNSGYFPELWFSDPRHADANQHLRIARVALAVSCLDTTTAGTYGDAMIASVQDEVLTGLKETVAIARCNPHCILASWKAAHAVHKFGVLLMDETARFKMIEFLEEVNAMGMPTAASIEYLVEQWNWRKPPGEW